MQPNIHARDAMHYSVKFILPAIAALVFLFAGCSKDDSPASVNTDPVADFSWTGATATPALLTFVNQSSNADRFQWDFGNGRTSALEAPRADFSDSGSFTITLIATASATSKADTISKILTITPGRVYLQAIFVDQIPFVNGTGATWDESNGPDLFYELLDEYGTALASSAAAPINDLSPTFLPLEWFFSGEGLQLSNWSQTLSVRLWDYDVTTNELIGGVTLKINDLIASQGYAQSHTLQNGSVRIRLSLAWQ
jgi:hypothetical protein